MEQNLYFIQFIDTEEMETYEITRTSNSREHLIKEANAVARNYNLHGYGIDKVRIFSADKKLLISYNL